MEASRIAFINDRLAVGLSCRDASHAHEFASVGVTHWADHRRTRCAEDVLSVIPNLTYLWNPTRDDGEAKPAEWYRSTISFAGTALNDPTSVVVVTCARGEHRGPSMAYAVMRVVLGLERGPALRALHSAWPNCDPSYAEDIDAKLDLLA